MAAAEVGERFGIAAYGQDSGCEMSMSLEEIFIQVLAGGAS